MIDTHTHLQFQAFDGITDQVIEEAKEAGILKMMVVGTDVETSKKAVDLVQKIDSLYAAVGIHPHHVFDYVSRHFDTNSEKSADSTSQVPLNDILKDLVIIEKLLTDPKVIAIGEVGMDRHVYKSTKYPSYQVSKDFISLQEKAFIAQIKLALKYQKTLIIHNREATDNLLELLAHLHTYLHTGSASNLKAVFHCCEPDQRLLDFAKKHHIYIGIDGDVTFDKAKQEFVKKIPLDLLVLETDSPFLAPKGFDFPNTPKNLIEINNFIAGLINKDTDFLKKITTKNSYELFSF